MGGSENSKVMVVGRLADSIREISGLPECQNVCKKMYGNLIRRVKLLSPLFEDLKDCDESLSDEEIEAFESLRVALDLTMILLKSVNHGSKLYQVWFFFLIPFVVLSERVNSVLYLIDGELTIHDKALCMLCSNFEGGNVDSRGVELTLT